MSCSHCRNWSARGLDVHHAVIGKGEDKQYLEQIRADSPMPERIHLLGGVSADDLPLWYAASDLFAMPNRDVGPTRKVSAWSTSKPPRADAPRSPAMAGGTGSAVLHGETGLRCDGNSLPAVTDALFRLLNPANGVAAECARRAELRAHRDFSWSAVAERTTDICSTLRR
jgi:phosphatidylinositol alpha-1,6-mannosyltransferase